MASNSSPPNAVPAVPTRPLVIGLAGGISSGKSSILKLVKELCDQPFSFPGVSVHTIDADKLGHAAYTVDTECYKKVVAHFSPFGAITNEDRTINRAVLGSIVFGDSSQMRALESIVWPDIRRQLVAAIQSRYTRYTDSATNTTETVFSTATGGVVVDPWNIVLVEAAVMIEAGFHDLLDVLLVSYVDPALAVERLMKRNNLSAEQAQSRISAQLTNAERLKYAHVSICNDADVVVLESRIRLVWGQILERFIGDSDGSGNNSSSSGGVPVRVPVPVLAEDEVARRVALLKAHFMPDTDASAVV